MQVARGQHQHQHQHQDQDQQRHAICTASHHSMYNTTHQRGWTKTGGSSTSYGISASISPSTAQSWTRLSRWFLIMLCYFAAMVTEKLVLRSAAMVQVTESLPRNVDSVCRSPLVICMGNHGSVVGCTTCKHDTEGLIASWAEFGVVPWS